MVLAGPQIQRSKWGLFAASSRVLPFTLEVFDGLVLG
jgi:hypothetical protein